MDLTVKQKLKKFIVAVIIIIPLAILAMWYLFPEPELMLVNDLSAATLSLEFNIAEESVLEITTDILSEARELDGIDQEYIDYIDNTVAMVLASQNTLEFVFDNSLYLTKTKAVAANLKQVKIAYEELGTAYQACVNYLENNFLPHMEGQGVTGITVNGYLGTYKSYFVSYAIKLAEFNKVSMRTISEATNRTISVNSLSLGLYTVKAEWEVLIVSERAKPEPIFTIDTSQSAYNTFCSLGLFNSSFTQYFADTTLYDTFFEVATSQELAALLAKFNSSEQAALVETYADDFQFKVVLFYSILA